MAEIFRTYRLLKLGVTIPESRLSRYEEDILMIIDDEVERMKAGTTKNKDGIRQHAETRQQAVGEYCEGADISECKKIFGDALNQVCRTCPD